MVKKKKLKGIENLLKKRIAEKKILKKTKTEVRIPEYKTPSVLGEPNRFFKDEWENTKKEMFLK